MKLGICKIFLLASLFATLMQFAHSQTVTVHITGNHAHGAKNVVETYKAQCSNFMYEFERSMEPNKLTLRTHKGIDVITTDLSDTFLSDDWSNGRYVWKPVLLCDHDTLMLNLQGIDLEGGRDELKVVSAYSQIEPEGKLVRYQRVGPEPRDHVFAYKKYASER